MSPEYPFSQERVAAAAGITASYISQIEKGHRLPSFEAFLNLCDILNVSPAELLGFQEIVTVEGLLKDPEKRNELIKKIVRYGLDRTLSEMTLKGKKRA
jgi:transcriptional regulator with XRE-family HTH domain